MQSMEYLLPMSLDQHYESGISLLEFLDRTKVLEGTDQAQVQEAKKIYRKLYLKDYKQRYTALNVRFTLNGTQAKKLVTLAEKEGLSPGRIARREVLGLLSGRRASFDPHHFAEVLVKVSDIHNQINRLLQRPLFNEPELFETLLKEVTTLKQELTAYRNNAV